MESPSSPGTESPIACVLDRFSPAERARWQQLGKNWRASVLEIRELPDGYALRIPSDATSVLAAAEWMTLDRLCCPFLTFVLEIAGEGGPVWLRLTGRSGVKEFMKQAASL